MRIFLSSLLALSLLSTPYQAIANQPVSPALDEAKTFEEAFVYAFPMVMNYGTMHAFSIDKTSSQFKAPLNQLSNTARVFTPQDTAIVTPNSDTPYSMIFLDLRAEPLVLSVPAIEKKRYYSLQFIDMYTHNYDYVGSRTTGNGAGRYLLAGPSWKGEKPAGVTGVIRCETEFSMVIYRTQLFGASDLDNVKKIQAGYQVTPLSKLTGGPAPAAVESIAFPAFNQKAAFGTDFIRYLNFVLQFCPETPDETELRARFRQLGIGSGLTFDFAQQPPARQAAIESGIKSALAKIEARKETLGENRNGWRVGAAFGPRSFYKGDWTLRAAAAMAGIYGNSREEALYPMLSVDAAGEKPDASKHRYTLTFPAGQLPPANAFWSVTMYDGKTQLLVDNPLNRYLINSPMLPSLQTNPDGSLTFYIQAESPGKALESNWLPAPKGPIFLVMRLYWPKDEAIQGAWKPPALQQVKPAQ